MSDGPHPSSATSPKAGLLAEVRRVEKAIIDWIGANPLSTHLPPNSALMALLGADYEALQQAAHRLERRDVIGRAPIGQGAPIIGRVQDPGQTVAPDEGSVSQTSTKVSAVTAAIKSEIAANPERFYPGATLGISLLEITQRLARRLGIDVSIATVSTAIRILRAERILDPEARARRVPLIAGGHPIRTQEDATAAVRARVKTKAVGDRFDPDAIRVELGVSRQQMASACRDLVRQGWLLRPRGTSRHWMTAAPQTGTA
jgi:hypothetical protein